MKRTLMVFILCAAPSVVQSQTLPKVFFACYVQNTGTLYRIREPGLPTQCTNVKHTEFSWIDGVPGYDHGALNGLADDDHPQYLLADGSRPLAGNLRLGGFRITGLAAATAAGEAVRFEQAVKTGDAAGGDLSGAYPSPTVAKLQGRPIGNTAPEIGQILIWSGSIWTPTTPPAPATGTPENTPNTLVQRDATGGFAAGLLQISHLTVSTAARIGPNTAAGSNGSVAMGANTTAGATASTAMGENTTASGEASVAMNNATHATGFGSTAMGSGSTASGFASVATGQSTTASGDRTTAMGNFASTDGLAGSFVYGDGSTIGTGFQRVVPTAANQFVVRAAGGLRLFTTSTTDGFVFEGGSGQGCTLDANAGGVLPKTKGGNLTCSGMIQSTEGGFWFPDGSVQTTAATGGGISDHGALTGLTDDDHPQYLLGDGVRASTNGFAVTGTVGSGAVPTEGSGTRLMWYPGKSAFRAGTVPGAHWDDVNVGSFSVAFGFATTASGRHATALGGTTTASGFSATALGDVTVASGNFATAMGTYASTNGQAGSFVYGDASTRGSQTFVEATVPNSFVARAQQVWFGRSGDQPNNPAGYLTADGVIASTQGGFKFPDGTVQTTAAAADASGTPNNTPSTLVQRDVSGGFAAGAVLLQSLGVTGNATVQGTTTVANRAIFSTDGGFVVRGTSGVGAIPATGAGPRLMWYSGKGAIRAGEASGTEWDAASVGNNSTAFGFHTTASGPDATALGGHTTASGPFSTAMGASTIASADMATAMGDGTEASGDRATAMGYQSRATAFVSTAFGYQTTASAPQAVSLGSSTTASGNASTAMGWSTAARGVASTAMGFSTEASGDFSTAMGNFASTDGRSGSFVYGDRGTVSPVHVVANNSFVVRAQHVWLGTAGDQVSTQGRYLETSTGAYLSTGGDWTNASDVNRKENFREVDGARVLDALSSLPIRNWNYRAEDDRVRHLGPTAQDFYAAFHLGDSDKSIGTVDEAGVALVAIQALERHRRDQAREIETLRGELAALRAMLDSLVRAKAQGTP